MRAYRARVTALLETPVPTGVPTYLTNVDPALRRGWHPVCRSTALTGEWSPVELLGEVWPVRRTERGAEVRDAFAATDHLGLVWIAPDEPVADLLDAPEAADPSYVSGWLDDAELRTAAGLMLDNQLDASHFPYVHVGTFGNGAQPELPDYVVEPAPGGFTASVAHAFINVNDPAVADGTRPAEQQRRVSYRFALPMQLQLRIEHLQTGQHTVILFGLQPARLDRTVFFTRVLRDDLPGYPQASAARTMAQTLQFEARVVAEDVRLQNSFTIPGLPLDQKLEMPVRADRSGIELRRQLAALFT